jgi:CBS domain containing-hemolysin-like protein
LVHTHSRIPVYHEQIDNIIWIITIRDILREQKAEHKNKKLWELHFKKFLKVPINQPIDILLETFKQTRQHIAIVMDEYGGVAGITTIEDIIEEVFWEIHDETDFETDEILEQGNDSYIVDSGISLDSILDEFNVSFCDIWLDEKEFWSETVSYIITHELERFPEKWEKICFTIYDENEEATDKKLCFTVQEIEDWSMWKVLVERK